MVREAHDLMPPPYEPPKVVIHRVPRKNPLRLPPPISRASGNIFRRWCVYGTGTIIWRAVLLKIHGFPVAICQKVIYNVTESGFLPQDIAVEKI